MEAASPARVLIVANRTAATPLLIQRVRERAAHGPCTFTLLVPRLATNVDPEGEEAQMTMALAIPLIEEAAAGQVRGVIGHADPFHAVHDLVRAEPFDEVIVSTLPQRVSRWLHRDLPRRVRDLGLPVTVVTARPSERVVWEDMSRYAGP